MPNGARTRLSGAMRSIGRRGRRTGMFKDMLAAGATVATFAAGQAKKAETAWGEYEAGYKELGGEGFERPKFGQKGYFKGPEGEVSIGEGKERKTYDVEKVRKAGAFLGTDAATALFAREGGDKIRDIYIKRTVPGRADPLRGKLKSSLTQMTGDTGTGFGQSSGKIGVGTGFGFTTGESLVGKDLSSNLISMDLAGGEGKPTKAYGYGEGYKSPTGVQHELAGKDFQPSIASGERGRDATGTAGIQARQQEQLNLMSQGRAPDVYRQTREGGAPIIQDNSLDAILQRQSASATSADKRTSVVSYGGGGRRIDPSIKYTGNEFIDKQFDGGGDVVTTKSGIPSLAEQAASATAADKRTAIIGRGGGGRNIDPSIKYTGNEFIDKQLGGTSSTVKGTGQTLDQILEEQSISATAADRGTSVIGYGGGGIGIDPNIQSTGNEFIDRQLGGYVEQPAASIYPDTRYGEYRKRLNESNRFRNTLQETYEDQY